MSGVRDIRLPALSATMEEATLIQWLVQPGEDIREGQAIAEVSTDKVDMEMESPFGGTVVELHVPEGSVVQLGAVLATVHTDAVDLLGDLGLADGGHEPAQTADSSGLASADPASPSSGRASSEGSAITPASPPARKLAARLGVDLRSVSATGVRGQVTPADVRRHADTLGTATNMNDPREPAVGGPEAPPAPIPSRPAATPGSRQDSVRKATASIMSASFAIPQFTLFRQLRLDGAAHRKGGETWTTVMVRALAAGLRVCPELNAFWRADAEDVAAFDAVRVGIAVDRPGMGLVVPSVAEPDVLDLDAADLAVRGAIDRARTGRLRPEDLAQASVTISNLGGMGVESFNALLFPPQAAILSVGSIAMRPVATADGALKAALTCTVGLTVDHRVADGADGARYLETIAALVEGRA